MKNRLNKMLVHLDQKDRKAVEELEELVEGQFDGYDEKLIPHCDKVKDVVRACALKHLHTTVMQPEVCMLPSSTLRNEVRKLIAIAAGCWTIEKGDYFLFGFVASDNMSAIDGRPVDCGWDPRRTYTILLNWGWNAEYFFLFEQDPQWGNVHCSYRISGLSRAECLTIAGLVRTGWVHENYFYAYNQIISALETGEMVHADDYE